MELHWQNKMENAMRSVFRQKNHQKSNMKEKRRNIGLVTFPISESGLIPLSNLIDILCPVSNEFHLITGGVGYSFFMRMETINAHSVEHKATNYLFTRAINYCWTQLKISRELLKLKKNVDLWIFFFGGEGLVIPIITAKILRKNAVIASAGSGLKTAQAQKDPLTKVCALLQSISYHLIDDIVVYSPRLIDEWTLTNHKDKILIAREHYLNFKQFNLNNNFNERDDIVGYVGRLSEEKGTLNFVRAILCISNKVKNVEFLIGGDGQLRGEIERYLIAENLNDKIKLTGWIPHEELTEYLNQLKLLVLPSYTEGLPNIMLEAMACGTPVLATPVGAIPDIIKDGETGFLMENNSPECIAANVIRALEYPDLEGVAQRARALVEREFTYEKAVVRWREILKEVGNDGR